MNTQVGKLFDFMQCSKSNKLAAAVHFLKF